MTAGMAKPPAIILRRLMCMFHSLYRCRTRADVSPAWGRGIDKILPVSHRAGPVYSRADFVPHRKKDLYSMPKPLAGVRVLELARILAGPWAGQMLADLGADVIKVERKGAGDDTRGWGPPFVEGVDGKHIGSAYFHATNRGKRSIELDFESEDGKRIVKKLAAHSDILIENFKVGGLAKFGLDYKSLAPDNPRLIYCSVTGFGQDGPYAPRAGYDLLVQGMGGIMDITGLPEGEPTRIGIPVADIFTGVYSVIGILSALAQREKTGRGCLVDTALLDTQVGVLANQGLSYLATGVAPKRIGNAHPVVVPYQVFPVTG